MLETKKRRREGVAQYLGDNVEDKKAIFIIIIRGIYSNSYLKMDNQLYLIAKTYQSSILVSPI